MYCRSDILETRWKIIDPSTDGGGLISFDPAILINENPYYQTRRANGAMHKGRARLEYKLGELAPVFANDVHLTTCVVKRIILCSFNTFARNTKSHDYNNYYYYYNPSSFWQNFAPLPLEHGHIEHYSQTFIYLFICFLSFSFSLFVPPPRR